MSFANHPDGKNLEEMCLQNTGYIRFDLKKPRKTNFRQLTEPYISDYPRAHPSNIPYSFFHRVAEYSNSIFIMIKMAPALDPQTLEFIKIRRRKRG